MIRHKGALRTDIPQRQQVPVRIATEQRVNEAGYLIDRYRVPSAEAEKTVERMSIAERTLLAIEMRERERSSYIADYDPFERL